MIKANQWDEATKQMVVDPEHAFLVTIGNYNNLSYSTKKQNMLPAVVAQGDTQQKDMSNEILFVLTENGLTI